MTTRTFSFATLKSFLGVAIIFSCTACTSIAQSDKVWKNRLADVVSQFSTDPKSPKLHSARELKRIWTGKPSQYFDDKQFIAICDAIATDNLDDVDRLMGSIGNINQEGKNGLTILIFAFLEGKILAFEKLLTRGASPDTAFAQELPLIPGIIGLDLRASNSSLLMFALSSEAIRPGFFDAAIKFTKKPNSLDRDGNTILHRISRHPYSESDLPRLKSVLAAGVDLNLKNSAGETAAQIAVQYNPKLLLAVLKAGADPRIPMPDGTSLIGLIHEKSTDPENPLNEHYDRVVIWLDEHNLRQPAR